VITADHGETFYEHGHWRHTYSLYDEIIRVPLIVKWPGRSPRGRVSAQVSQLDVFPTLLKEAGVAAPHSGAVNLRSYLESERDSSSALAISEVIIPDETSSDVKMKFALRTRETKYIAALGSSDGVTADPDELQKEELYYLADDPGEQSNLAEQLPRETEMFRQELFAYLDRAKQFGARGKGEPVELDDELGERLRALGYVVH
jgi:choline-sulfatase